MDWMQSPQKWAMQTLQLCDRGFAGDLVGGVGAPIKLTGAIPNLYGKLDDTI